MNRDLPHYEDIIPNVVYFRSRPNVFNLQIFGSDGQMLFKDDRNKFDSRTVNIKMVGYERDLLYRVYVPELRKIYTSSAFRFNEKSKCENVSSNIPFCVSIPMFNEDGEYVDNPEEELPKSESHDVEQLEETINSELIDDPYPTDDDESFCDASSSVESKSNKL